MKNFLLKYKSGFIGIALGAVAGLLYWRFVGCSSGTCAITSTWHNSMIYGALMGYLFSGSFSGKKKEEKQIT